MSIICKCIRIIIEKCLCIFCSPLYIFFFMCNQRRRVQCTYFFYGWALGQAYYYYLIKRLPLPQNLEIGLSITIRILLGILNALSIQMRCISLLLLPMYCGKAGRGILKVILLTYVVAGPIANMGKNAHEVVRVFSCATQLSYNLSKEEHRLLSYVFKKTALSLQNEMEQLKETFRAINDVMTPIQYEVEDLLEVQREQAENDILDNSLCIESRSQHIEKRFSLSCTSTNTFEYKKKFYQYQYQKKLAYRCENLLTHAVAVCIEAFDNIYDKCLDTLPELEAWIMCGNLKIEHACNNMHVVIRSISCDGVKMDPGFGEGYLALKEAKQELTDNLENITLQYKVTYEHHLYEIQDAKETGERVTHAFEEKITLINTMAVVLNLYVAILILRIHSAAIYYHDKYLTSIEHDNIYVTGYFKLLDQRRKERKEKTLLPLKKMERSKYIDFNSVSHAVTIHDKLLAQLLKVMLEMVTATTFVMLDRLFYEALDVVRQHAETDGVQHSYDDLKVEVEGTGMLASFLRKLFSGFSSKHDVYVTITNKECLPNPRSMAIDYYFKIYGGYLWIVLLLCIDPYTVRLRRLICGYFYPQREKKRILHLYNDILKKRMKMQKTLRRKAVQGVRAHYLSGENLLSLRMKFPHLLGWLRMLPAARMTCLICNETEPRVDNLDTQRWYSCRVSKCPFIYCGECWLEAGAQCLACDPSLVELTDIDSLDDEELPKY